MHPALLKSAQLINLGDIAGAEKALVSIADIEGDHALVAVLDVMAPKDLLSVIREFDSSNESVVNLVVTPEQFARAVVLETQYNEHSFSKVRSHVRLQGMINAVVHRNAETAFEFLEAIANTKGGISALADYFTERFEEIVKFTISGHFAYDADGESQFEPETYEWLLEKIEYVYEALSDAENKERSVSRSEVADGDWMETAWILRYELPDMYEEMLNLLCTTRKKWMESVLNSPQELFDDTDESAI